MSPAPITMLLPETVVVRYATTVMMLSTYSSMAGVSSAPPARSRCVMRCTTWSSTPWLTEAFSAASTSCSFVRYRPSASSA